MYEFIFVEGVQIYTTSRSAKGVKHCLDNYRKQIKNVYEHGQNVFVYERDGYISKLVRVSETVHSKDGRLWQKFAFYLYRSVR